MNNIELSEIERRGILDLLLKLN